VIDALPRNKSAKPVAGGGDVERPLVASVHDEQ